jgi:multidrug resistance efflux pump
MTKGNKMFDKVLEAVFMFDTSKWKQERKYVVRRNVVFGLIAVIAFVVIWTVAKNLWWTENGYCWGDMVECYFGGK